nr:MAG TPA: hypothetical protein [Bacteriophage sp.]DAS96354.1 MAG TPA: hypothetical protein [Caudoviricetes sp.]
MISLTFSINCSPVIFSFPFCSVQVGTRYKFSFLFSIFFFL